MDTSRRRRTPRRLLGLAVALLAVASLTACGANLPGAAAVIGSQRLTTTTVDSQSSQLLRLRGAAVSSLASNGQLQRDLIQRFVLDQVLQRAAGQLGLTVTPGQVDRARASYAAQLGGAQGLTNQLLQQNVAPSQANAFLRDVVLYTKIGEALVPGSAASLATERTARASAYLTKVARGLTIRVSPRFGQWDPASGTVVAPTGSGLSSPDPTFSSPASVTGP
ncbi:MAG: SurA N-terminal domain-containing protein [Actinomycetes bacterium]